MHEFQFEKRDLGRPFTGIVSDPTHPLESGDLAQLHDGQVAVYAKIVAVNADCYKGTIHSFLDLSGEKRSVTTFRGHKQGDAITFTPDVVISFIQSVRDGSGES